MRLQPGHSRAPDAFAVSGAFFYCGQIHENNCAAGFILTVVAFQKLRGWTVASDDGDPFETGQPPLADGTERLSNKAVQELYEVHSRELLAFLIGVLRDGHAADEVAQTTFARLMEAGHEARAETIKGWLFKVGFHEAMAFRRRQALQGKTLKNYTVRRDPLPANQGVHEELMRREDVAKLKELLAELPPDQQHVVRQRMYEGKTFAVIADELNVPLGTVLTRMRLAMEKLQKWWGRDQP